MALSRGLTRFIPADVATTSENFQRGEMVYDPVTNLLRVSNGSGDIDYVAAVNSNFFQPVVNPMAYGAVGDGVADDTFALRLAALAGLIWLPADKTFRFDPTAGPLMIALNYGGITGSGRIISSIYADKYICVVAGTKFTKFTDFTFTGPGPSSSLLAEARALTIGTNADGSALTDSHWDSYAYIDNVTFEECGSGMLLTYADWTTFGTIRCFNVGNAEAQRGYGISCSGSYVQGQRMIHHNTTTRGRHAIYWNGDASYCHVEEIIAQGFDKNPFNARTSGPNAGRSNTVGMVIAIDCNTVPEETAGICNWSVVSGETAPDAGYPAVNRILAVNCGGKMVQITGHPNARIGEIIMINNTGYAGSSERYVAHFQAGSHGAWVGKISAQDLNDNTIRVVLINDTDNVKVDQVRVQGVYDRIVTFAGTSTGNKVTGIEPLTPPVGPLFSDSSSGTKLNYAECVPGYDTVTITDPANLTPSVVGMKRILLSYTSPASVTNFIGGYEGQVIDIISTNANATLVHSGAANTLQLRGAVNRLLGTRGRASLELFGTRWLEA